MLQNSETLVSELPDSIMVKEERITMGSISGNNKAKCEIDDAGKTIINFGLFKDRPMTLTEVLSRNIEREIKWLYYIGNIMPVVNEDKRAKEIKKNIVIYLESQGICKSQFI